MFTFAYIAALRSILRFQFLLLQISYFGFERLLHSCMHKGVSSFSTSIIIIRGGVEDTRLDAKAKDTKKIRGQGQGQPFRGQTLSRPRKGMLEAKDTSASALQKKKKGLHKNFQAISKKKKVFSKFFQAISTKKRFPKNFSSALQNFNIPKNSAVLEPRTGQFSRSRCLEAKDFKFCPRGQERPRGLHLW